MRPAIACALAIVILAPLAPAAQDRPKADWVLDPKSGCKVWDDALEADETVSWSSTCTGDLAEGKGTAQWYVKGKAEERYDGEMRAGKMHGKGVLSFPNGMRYEGEFKDNTFDGRGKLTYPNGEVYEGEFRNDDRSGQGSLSMAGGTRYVGQWDKDMPHGQGAYIKADGSKYDGDWQMGCLHLGPLRLAVVATPRQCGIY